MRGIGYTLICSMFLNSTLGFLPNDTLSFGKKQVSAYETTLKENATEDIILEKNILSKESISDNGIISYNLDSEEENTVSKNDRDVDALDFDINDYIIIGEDAEGNSIAVKKSTIGKEDEPSKPFSEPDFDWSTVNLEGDIETISTQAYEGVGEEKGKIYVSSEADMLVLASMWEQGETFKGMEIVQTGNITFTKIFPGIGFGGNDAEKFGFQGTFDGNGYVFYGLKYIADKGIFPVIGRDGVVKNVTLLAEDLYLKSGEVQYFNPLTERNLGLIENYCLDGNITADKQISVWGCTYMNLGIIRDSVVKGNINAGNAISVGFAMYNQAGGQIINCYNYSDIKMQSGGAVGITGNCQGTILQINEDRQDYITVMAGGYTEDYPRGCFPEITSKDVLCYQDKTKNMTFYYLLPLVKDCYNYGDISSDGRFVAGIVNIIYSTGYSIVYKDDAGNVLSIKDWEFLSNGAVVHCINYGDISGLGVMAGVVAQYGDKIVKCANYGTIKGSRQLGGIGGIILGLGSELQNGVVESVNYGDIVGNASTGGICGSTGGSFYNNYNRGNITLNESAQDNDYQLGGLAGWAYATGKIDTSYSTGEVDMKSGDCNGLIGTIKEGNFPTASNLYLSGNMKGIENQPGYVTKDWLKSDQALAALGSAFKKDSYGINDGYPILQWQTAKADKMQVRFVTQGGSSVEIQYLYGGEIVKEPNAPIKEEYIFDGWYTDLSYTTKWNFSKPVTSGMSLYAKWMENPEYKKYKVTVLLDGGTYDLPYMHREEIYVTEGSLLEDIEVPIKLKHSFVGWGIDGSTTKLWDMNKDRVTKDIELKAIWKKESLIRIIYYHCGADNQKSESNTVYASYASKLDFYGTYTKKDHELKGWFTEKNGKGTQYTAGTRLYGNLTLYAYWISNERYTVTFDTMGGNSIPSTEGIVPESCIDLPLPVKEHSVFMGWYTQPDGEGECYTNKTPVTESLTLYAFWQEDIKEGDYRIQAIENQTYTGNKIIPEVKIYYQDQLLTKDKDYTLTYVNCVSVGTAKVYIRFDDNKKKYQLKYQIIEKNLEDEDVSCKVYNSYKDSKTGFPQMPMVEIAYQNQILKKDKDYTVKQNEESGKYSVIITGKDNFTGKREISFAVEEKNIADVVVKKVDKFSYTGKEIKPALEVTAKEGTPLIAGQDYECVYSKNIVPGKAQIEIRGIGVYAGSKKVTFTIVKKPMSEQEIKVTVAANETYDGAAKQPAVVVMHEDTLLEKGKDYTVSYSNNKNASEKAVVTIKGKGNYSGQQKATFVITPKHIEGTVITVEDGLYNKGKEVKPKVVVKDGMKTLKNNKDYKIQYSNNTEAGNDAKVIIQGIGNYSESSQQSFRIVSDLITKAKVNRIDSYVYSGESFKPKVEVYYNNQLLTENTDYQLKYPEEENINAGKGCIYIVGQGTYGGRKKVTYTINKKTIESISGEFTLQSVETLKYTGNKVTPKVEFLYKGTVLTEGVDYKLSYQSNVNAGNKAKVTIQGIGNFTGKWVTNFVITPADITEALMEAQDTAYKKGKSATPKVVVKYNNKTLKVKKDYVVTYDSNNQCQDGEVSVKGIGNFAGLGEQTVKVPYHVYEISIGKVKYQKINTVNIVSDEILEPSVKLSYEGKTLKENVDYELEYSNNSKPGKGKIIIRGKGRFGGNKTITFQIKKK